MMIHSFEQFIQPRLINRTALNDHLFCFIIIDHLPKEGETINATSGSGVIRPGGKVSTLYITIAYQTNISLFIDLTSNTSSSLIYPLFCIQNQYLPLL